MAPSILLVGFTGNIGTMIAQELLRRTIELRRVAFYARPGASSEKQVLYAMAEALGMERVEGEIRDIAVYRGFDIVICCLSHDSILDQISIIYTALAGGVRHIIPPEFGGIATNKP
ncbi:hypothetical protein VE00_10821 [Pseudogymnoascus sp. WSF 3629]|nr:hypothetical protein VE00_10821 [Pseudogymnoascus sp. WSF 3629]